MVLTCMATGFSSTHTIIQIKRDGRVLTRHDGVESTGIRPNGDGTFQQKDHVEIPKSEHSKYTCEVIHASSGLHEVRGWGKQLFLINSPRTKLVQVSVRATLDHANRLVLMLLLLIRPFKHARKSKGGDIERKRSPEFTSSSWKILWI